MMYAYSVLAKRSAVHGRPWQVAVAVVALVVVMSGQRAQAQTTYYVAPCGDDSWSGLSPICAAPGGPKASIRVTIPLTVDGDEVVVAEGTYTGSLNKNMSFAGKLITVRCDGEPGTCIIDCENSGRGFNFSSGETEDAVVDGFTITGGNRPSGGGMLIGGSSPTVTNCTFDGNSATNGGGMYCQSSSSPAISNCTFTENIVTGSASQWTGTGGAIYLLSSSPTIDNCLFSRNTANAGASTDTGSGGAIMTRNSSPVIENCTFIDNQAVGAAFARCGGGGGLFAEGGNVLLRNCTFVGNAANVGTVSLAAFGGGVFTFQSDSELTNCIFIGNKAIGGSPPIQNTGKGGGFIGIDEPATLTNCIFAGNSATGDGSAAGAGGGVYGDDNSTLLTNCAIIGNSAESNGGGVWIGGVSTTAELTNCTLSGNSAGDNGGGILSTTQFGGPVATSVDNCIVWDNAPNAIVDEFAAVTTVRYTDVQGDWLGPGEFNIFAAPLFLGGPSGSWSADGVYDADAGQTTLTDDAAGWEPGALVGMFINPDISQTLQSLIVANDATTVTMWANFAGLGTVGADYQIRDYHVLAGSPVIDAADNTAVPFDTTDLDDDGDTDEPIPFDLDGNPRFVDDPDTEDCQQAPGECGESPVVDMGAYEYPGASDGCGDCPTDTNGDGETGPFDLATLLAAWGPVEPGNCLDANGDGDTGPFDLATLLAAWGPCP